MNLSPEQPKNTIAYRNIPVILRAVMTATKELTALHDYHRAEFEMEGFQKAFGRFNGVLDIDQFKAVEDSYELEDSDQPYWCFKSENGFVLMYSDGVIEVAEVTDNAALADEIIALINKLYAANFPNV